jgi:hypothetical protein
MLRVAEVFVETKTGAARGIDARPFANSAKERGTHPE